MKPYLLLLTLFFLSGCSNETPAPAQFTDIRDGQVYKQIAVEGLIWMAEDLRYDAISYSFQQGLFQCPDGWSLPTHHDWANLTKFYGGYDTYDVEIGDSRKAYQALKKGGSSGLNLENRYWTQTPTWLDAPQIRSFCAVFMEDEKKAKLGGNPIGSMFNCRCVKREREVTNGSVIEVWVDGVFSKYEAFPMYYPPDENDVERFSLFLYKELEPNQFINRISLGMEIPSSEVNSNDPYFSERSGIVIGSMDENNYSSIGWGNYSEEYMMKVTKYDGEWVEGEFSGLTDGNVGISMTGTFRILLPNE